MEGAVLFSLGKAVLEVVASSVPVIQVTCGFHDELDELKRTISEIQAVLIDTEQKGYPENEVKDWLEDLEDVLHDANDVLDDISTEALQRKVMARNKMTKEVRIFFSSSNQLAFSLKMGHRIKAFRKRLNKFEEYARANSHFIQNSFEPQFMNRDRETYSVVLEKDVVGREDDKNKIINSLLDSNTGENVSIIPIVGIGGVGKTALAQLIYNDEIVKNNFELKLWIYVSNNFDLKHIVKKMLESLEFWRHEVSFEILQNNLREKLSGKKYFLVLDDVWNEDPYGWNVLRNLLMGGARGSRIVVTTRSTIVAEITGTTLPHELRGLNPGMAWSLFVKVAFKGGIEPKNPEIIALGREIVKKCIGVPLAIRTIGSLLYDKTSENEWRSFLKKELSELTQQVNDISLTLKLSYDHLPSKLKQCFAYCGLFPKDYRINISTLVNLWVANEFIVLEGPQQRYEDVGRIYVMELLWRSFFQEVENDELGNIKSCKMNNLMRDLAVLQSRTKSAILNSSGNSVNEKVRHVSFNLVNLSTPFSILMQNLGKVRTVLISSVWGNLGNLTCDGLISNLKYLRALDLSYLDLHVVPHSIGKLKHLRYLDLSGNYYIKILPNSITKMLNLQTLILESCHSLRELPGGIKRLVNLRYLDITYCDELTNMPLEISHLTKLEIILPCLVVRMESSKGKSVGLSDLKGLRNLGGELRIENLGHGKDDIRECIDANLKEKQHLERLSLKWDESNWDVESENYDEMLKELQPHQNLKWLWLENYMGVGIPIGFSYLTNLVYFVLRKNRRLQDLPPLNHLPSLKYISLHGMEALEYISDEDSVSNVLGASPSSSSSSSKTPFFPSLSSLYIWDCPKLTGWWRNSDDDNEPHHLSLPSFPSSLSKLRIWNCPNLNSMPPFPYLEEPLTLRGCSWKVLEQTMKMKMKMGAATTSTDFPLSQLQELQLEKIDDLESLPEEGLQNLVSLRELYIKRCDGLSSLCRIGSLTSLQTLEIWSCPKLTSLPQEIRSLTTLKKLRIYQCPELMSFPQAICNLTSLKELRIDECPLLGQSCKRRISEDWPGIALIVRVDGQNLREETISSVIAEYESESASPTSELTETENKLGLKIRNLFKNCNCATAQTRTQWPWPSVLEFWLWSPCVKLRQQTRV